MYILGYKNICFYIKIGFKQKKLNKQKLKFMKTKVIFAIITVLMMIACGDEPLISQQSVQKQPKVVSQTRAAVLGNEFVKYNEEDFKDHPFEPKEVSNDFKEAENRVLREFPNATTKSKQQEVYHSLYSAGRIRFDWWYVYDSNKIYDLSYHLKNCFVMNDAKELYLFVPVVFKLKINHEHDWVVDKAYNPKEVIDELGGLYNPKLIHYVPDRDYQKQVGETQFAMKYVHYKWYCKFTGFSEKDILSLRRTKIPSNRLYGEDSEQFACGHELFSVIMPSSNLVRGLCYSKTRVETLSHLKPYIKKGSIITIKHKEANINGVIETYHSFMVTGYYHPKKAQEIKIGDYLELEQYKQLNINQDFLDIPDIVEDIADNDVSLAQYLRRFVFIETTPDTYDNKLPYANQSGGKYTPGNDSKLQKKYMAWLVVNGWSSKAIKEILDKKDYEWKEVNQYIQSLNGNYWSEIYVSNLDYSIRESMPLLTHSALNNAKKYLGKPYRYVIFNGENFALKKAGKTFQHCSGLIYMAYYNDGVNPFVDLIPMGIRKKMVAKFAKVIHFDFGSSLDDRYYQPTFPENLIENPYVDTNYWK